MNFLSPYLGLAKALAVVAVLLAAFGAGVKLGSDHVQADWDLERRERAEATLQLERETRRAVDAITVNNQKEKSRAKATIDSLRADVRSGVERLSVAVAACSTGDAGTGHPEARAELLPEAADRIVGIAADADEAVRDLNECVDKYDAVRKLANGG